MIQMTDIGELLKSVSDHCECRDQNPCGNNEAETLSTCDPKPLKYLPVERGGKAGGPDEVKVWPVD